MVFQRLINALKEVLQEELPGEKAQLNMAPYDRAVKEEAMKNAPTPKPGAVLVLIYPVNNIPHIIFILRNAYLGVHSAQVSFPGGRKEQRDTSLMQTALRESEEEIGIRSSDISIIGNLTEIYIPPSGYLVEPFIGYLDYRPKFIPDPREVDKIIEFPLLELLNEGIVKTTTIQLKMRDSQIEAPYFDIKSHVVWGATAMMLSELKELLRKSTDRR